jgi:hypothetical protein
MLTTPADKWFSLCVRERANWTCERCGVEYSHPARGLDCAHYETRDNWSVRFDPINAFALCRGCHGYYDRERRFEFKDLYIKVFGAALLDILEEKSRQSATLGKTIRRTRGKGEIALHYKKQYEGMLLERSKRGRVDFEGWL